MLCLQRTFEGTNLPALVHKIVEVSFEPVKGKYSDELKQVVQKMLQKDPKRRPSASELYDNTVPSLLRAIQIKEGIVKPEKPAVAVDDKDMKSFIYYLDGKSLTFLPVHCPLKDRIANVAVGYSHIVAVTFETVVYSWGDNSHGQLGHGNLQTHNVPTVISSLKGRNIINAMCGGEFSMFKNENGIIMSCGRGDKGVLGHGNFNDCFQPEIIQELLAHDSHVISCGESHVAVITLETRVFVWGSGEHGQLGTGDEYDCCVPTELIIRSPGARMDEKAVDVHCGIDATVFITEIGRVFACGNNTDNKLGLNKRETFIMQMKKILNKQQLQVPFSLKPMPVKDLGKHRIVDCSLGSTHSAFLTETGLVYTFGRNREGQLGSGNCVPREMANIVKGFKDTPMIVTCSELATIVATTSNTFHIWGSRPAIKSPLSQFLCDINSPSNQQSHGSNPELTMHSSSKSSSHVETLHKSLTSQSSAMEVKSIKHRSFENVKELDQKQSPKQSPKQQLRNSNSEIVFSDAIHNQVQCKSPRDYMKTLYNTLNINNEGETGFTRQTSGSVALNKNIKKGGSQGTLETPKDVILKPVVIDLVNRKETLKSLWEQGMKKVKLEGISCFGCNMIILLHAHLSKEDNQQGVVIGNRLLKRSMISLMAAGLPSSPWRPLDPPFTIEEKDENNETAQRSISRNPSVLSDSGELHTWIKEELKDGIPLEGEQIHDVEVSHGWFPESLRGPIPTNDTINKELIKQPLPYNNISSKKFSQQYTSISHSAVQIMESSGLIPSTIQETNELECSSTENKTIKVHVRKMSDQKSVITTSNESLKKSSQMPAKPPNILHVIKPAKSIADLPTPSKEVLNVKRANSSGNISSKRNNNLSSQNSTNNLLKHQEQSSSSNSLKKQQSHKTLKVPPGLPAPVKRPSTNAGIAKKHPSEIS
jgi:NIMA (never in mitosis gene a)-related kinase